MKTVELDSETITGNEKVRDVYMTPDSWGGETLIVFPSKVKKIMREMGDMNDDFNASESDLENCEVIRKNGKYWFRYLCDHGSDRGANRYTFSPFYLASVY